MIEHFEEKIADNSSRDGDTDSDQASSDDSLCDRFGAYLKSLLDEPILDLWFGLPKQRIGFIPIRIAFLTAT